MSELSVTALADRPCPRGEPSAVMCSTPPETNIVFGTTLKLAGRPSAPQGRTVRSYVFHTTRDEHRLWYNFEISRRTVRTLGADRPPYRSSPQPEKTPSLVHFELQRQTVRPPGPDCPPANLNSHSSSTCSLVRCGPSAPQRRTVRTCAVSSQT